MFLRSLLLRMMKFDLLGMLVLSKFVLLFFSLFSFPLYPFFSFFVLFFYQPNILRQRDNTTEGKGGVRIQAVCFQLYHSSPLRFAFRFCIPLCAFALRFASPSFFLSCRVCQAGISLRFVFCCVLVDIFGSLVFGRLRSSPRRESIRTSGLSVEKGSLDCWVGYAWIYKRLVWRMGV
jgi:hypothetical protein